MEQYKNIEQIGEGTYGKVFKATDINTNNVVAIKRMEIETETGFHFTTIREIKMLKKLKSPHIIELLNVFTDKRYLYLELEFMPYDLAGLIKSGYQFTDDQIKSLSYQLISAVDFVHSYGMIHRDIKSGNVLLKNDGTLKLADFGLTRNTAECMTNKVCSLWYRSPELLLGSSTYNIKIDSWAIGCVILEMKIGKPVFEGKDEINQAKIILKALGPPKESYRWSNVLCVDKYIKNISWIEIMKKNFGKYFDEEMLQFIGNFLIPSPEKRISPQIALTLNFMKNIGNSKFSIDSSEKHEFSLNSTKKIKNTFN